MFIWEKEEKSYPLISAMKARKLLCQRCFGYWCYAIDTQTKEDKAKNIHVDCEFECFS